MKNFQKISELQKAIKKQSQKKNERISIAFYRHKKVIEVKLSMDQLIISLL